MIKKLIDEIKRKNAPIVVGLDPQLGMIPESCFPKDEEDIYAAISEALFTFNKKIVDATYDLIPAVKPQIAMYEQFGIGGIAAFKRTVDYCHEKGLVVIGDVKRGDIGSTSASYAVAHLGRLRVEDLPGHLRDSYKNIGAPFDEDFATVNPYLGTDGIKPFVDVCRENDKGIFVLVKTSNPSSGELQDQVLSSTGRPLYEYVGEMVERWGTDTLEGDYTNVGAVVGATYPEMGRKLREIMPHTYILVPGYGAQGGTGADLKPFFNKDGLGAIVNSSRGIIAAYKSERYADRFTAESFADAARAAVVDMVEDIVKNALQ